jgi:hypothetical protein
MLFNLSKGHALSFLGHVFDAENYSIIPRTHVTFRS